MISKVVVCMAWAGVAVAAPTVQESTAESPSEAAAANSGESDASPPSAEVEPNSEPAAEVESSKAEQPEAPAPAPKESASTLVVLPIQFSSLPPEQAEILDELLIDAVRRVAKRSVLGKSDIDAMLGLENLKDQLGCDDTTCAAELGGALGADRLLASRVAKLGDSIVIVLKLIDTARQVVETSIKHKAPNDESQYDTAIDRAVDKLFGIENEEELTAPAATADTPPEEGYRFSIQVSGGTAPSDSRTTVADSTGAKLASKAAILIGWSVGVKLSKTGTFLIGLDYKQSSGSIKKPDGEFANAVVEMTPSRQMLMGSLGTSWVFDGPVVEWSLDGGYAVLDQFVDKLRDDYQLIISDPVQELRAGMHLAGYLPVGRHVAPFVRLGGHANVFARKNRSSDGPNDTSWGLDFGNSVVLEGLVGVTITL